MSSAPRAIATYRASRSCCLISARSPQRWHLVQTTRIPNEARWLVSVVGAYRKRSLRPVHTSFRTCRSPSFSLDPHM
jgi:hypothetical protein